jgi:hypothetical protein
MTATMNDVRLLRPGSDEYAPYYGKYIGLVGDGDIVRRLEEQIAGTMTALAGVPEGRAGHRYGPDKWSIREVVGHLADAERVFAYRAMRFARADATPLPGFEENAFVANASFESRTLASLADEYAAVRRASVAFFGALTPEEWLRGGVASSNVVTVRALAWIAAGHELHHRQILRERYGVAGEP